MAANDLSEHDVRGEEITELLNAIKQRVRARYPSSSVSLDSTQPEPVRIALPDLMPLLYARDAAQAKVAAIGSVNPRAGGLLNKLIQGWKRTIARSLSWFVRDQVTFNRQMMACVETTIEALTEVNASISSLAGHLATQAERLEAAHREAAELREIRVQWEASRAQWDAAWHAHWETWRAHWEHALSTNEMQFLRSAADLQTGFTHRSTMMETNFRDMVRGQHGEYLAALDRSTLDIQKRLWADLEKVRVEYERLIHNELRVVRQRLLAKSASHESIDPPPPLMQSALGFDYARFADRFRGSEEYVRANQEFYLPIFREAGRVLDLGCGRGEFLELLRENGIAGRGVESSAESANYCRAKGLDVEQADLFEYLDALSESSEDVIFCSQVVEHLDPARLPTMIRLCASRLRKGGLLAIETPNPECLAIFATHFYLDPTHTRPVPPALLAFHLEECGMSAFEVRRFAPAAESFPEINSLPPDFADKFFGGMDYAIIARKLN